MSYENAIIKCSLCGDYTIVGLYNGELDGNIEDYEVCSCGAKLEIIEWEDIEDIPAIITIAENELENANYHEQIDLVQEVWDAIENRINPKDKVYVARKIAEIFINSI